MPADASTATTRRAVDEAAQRRMVARLQQAPGAPWLHGEVARRMAERLSIVKLKPRRALDWWSHIGGGVQALAAASPHARIDTVEPGDASAARPPWWSVRRWVGGRRAWAAADVADGEAQLVWANMMLHATPDPLACMRQWHRVLSVDGFLMFTTLGPGTLAPLRALYANLGWGVPMAPLVDMHDLGDMLVEAGFADPVMDQETLTLTWRDGAQALAELRTLGANVDPGRTRGMRTPRWRRRLVDELDLAAARNASGRVELTFEIVYGHAFKPPLRRPVADEAAVPLADMRAMLRASRRQHP